MAAYMSLTGGDADFYRDGDCNGHLVGTLDALNHLLAKEPAKHFLTREPLNAAEEYAQAVGWKLLLAV